MGACCSTINSRDAAAEASLPDVRATMNAAFGKDTVQTGFTDGHTCIMDSDKNTASEAGASLLYGELLPMGVCKLMNQYHLAAGSARSLLDLGMGTGKLVMQVFLLYPNLTRVVGVELSRSRYAIAEAAVLELARIQGWEVEARDPGRFVRIRTLAGCGESSPRTLEVRHGNMWKASGVALADIIVMHTDLTETCVTELRRLISKAKVGVRFVTYQDLTPYWRKSVPPFEQIAENIDESDTFLTSWSSTKGYHLFCWEKIASTPAGFRVEGDYDTKEAIS
ncbi:hypothetical protein FNF27_02880 [Cafeteria roenbergensis]|nr:hypothetical protein FNF27_02880 [Cafeteria roenbergensis]